MVEMRVFSTFANIMVSIPSEYYGKTSGLCGKADGLASNDMQDKNGRQYVHNSGGQAPTEFTESWRYVWAMLVAKALTAFNLYHFNCCIVTVRHHSLVTSLPPILY